MFRLWKTLAAGVVAAALTLPAEAQTRAQTRENLFLPAKSWAFQLVNLGTAEREKIAQSPFDVVVIDSEHFEDANREIGRPLTREEIDKMKVKPDGSRRLVIAYFSIGEAEDYRTYWKKEWSEKRPSWIGKESKEWSSNYYIQYWNPGWQDIILKFSEQVVDSGFDGFYIDRADAYYNFGDTKQARDRMEAFVIRLTSHIRARKPDAQILVQNAEELLDRPAYVQAIDGIAKEDLLYGISHKEEPNKKGDIDWSVPLLTKFQAQKKKVFVIEYLLRPDYVADAKKRLDALGFTMYMGPRGLASLNLAAGDIASYKGPTPELLAEAKAAAAEEAKQKAAFGGAGTSAQPKQQTPAKQASSKSQPTPKQQKQQQPKKQN